MPETAQALAAVIPAGQYRRLEGQGARWRTLGDRSP
jgi:hypothetical protein